MSESENEGKSSIVNLSTDDITLKFAEFLRNLQTTPTTHRQTSVNADNLGEVVVSTKLTGDNYPLWANLIRRAIGGKGLTSHISKNSEPPAETDPGYETWQKLDHCVFGWIINNMEPELVNEVSQYPTAQELWEGLAVTYGSGGDSLQVYDLHRKASNMKQGELTLEQLWHRLQNIWMSIDRKKPNPMKDPEDITVYNRERQETRLFQFLMALNDNHESTRREILKRIPLPSVRDAYATVRREATNDGVLKPTPSDAQEIQANGGIGTGLAARGGGRPGQTPLRRDDQRDAEDRNRLVCSHCGGRKHTKDQCFLLVGYPEWWDEMKRRRGSRNGGRQGGTGTITQAGGDRAAGAANAAGSTGTIITGRGESRGEGESSEQKAEEMGTARVCRGKRGSIFEFNPQKFVGFSISPPSLPISHNLPHVLRKLHKTPHTLAIRSLDNSKLDNEPHFSHIVGKRLIENSDFDFNPGIKCENSFAILETLSTACLTSEKQHKDRDWIFDCGATDTMSFDIADFTEVTGSKKSYVQTANGELLSVQGAGTIKISPTLRISNCLYVPSLSHKLLSVSHVTKELNCTLLMQPFFCMLQDTRTGTIVGRGT